jgi:hypothetical protein
MQHFEYLYLLGQAHKIWRYEEEARARGGTFHASDHFLPVGNVRVQLRIVRLTPERLEEEPALVLRVRHKKDVSLAPEAVATITTAVFGPTFVHVPYVIDYEDEFEHQFYSHVVPPDPLTPPASS